MDDVRDDWVGEPATDHRRRPAWLWPATAWFLGTALAVTFSVFAINLAGAGVSDRASLALSPARVANALSVDAPATRSSATPPTSTPKPAATSSPPSGDAGPASPPPPATGPAPTDPSGRGETGSGSRSSSGEGAGDTTTTVTATPTTTATPSSTRSVSSQGGTATFQCIGSALSLLSAAPAAGYETDKKTATEVLFVRDVPPHSSQITATCSAGVVTARVREIADS